MAVPYTFAERIGNVPAEYLDADFAYLEAQLASLGTVTAYTADHVLTTDENGQTSTNAGAAGTISLTLPTPAAGLTYTFVVVAAQSLVVDVAGSVVIAIGEGAPTSPGGSISCASQYSVLTLKAVSATLWVGINQLGGAWTPS
jgi:hypothetical protein